MVWYRIYDFRSPPLEECPLFSRNIAIYKANPLSTDEYKQILGEAIENWLTQNMQYALRS